jgi:23S rRNA pseudouridine1911/1915/1917 synthase
MQRSQEAKKPRNKDEKLKIVYEDDCLLIAEKPAGLPCLPAKGSGKTTLYDLLLKTKPFLKKVKDAGLAHRLDNDTSGLVLVAKTNEIYEKLRRQFDEGKVLKEYSALVIGNPPDKGTITTPIAHHPRKKKKMIVSLNGRTAYTTYKVIKRFKKQCALLNVRIKTGVRHQIRAHLASIGFPLSGDILYQNVKKRNEDKFGLSRHFLHATKISFLHPKTNKRIEIYSDLAKDLKDALSNLETIGD